MGEIDIVISHPHYGPTGYQYAFLTVFFAWAPLAVAGIALKQTGVVHATMRGAGALRVLAQLAIAVQVAALTFSSLFASIFMDAAWLGFMSYADFYAGMIVGVAIMLPCVVLSAAGLRGWHHVLNDLSHRGESRMLA